MSFDTPSLLQRTRVIGASFATSAAGWITPLTKHCCAAVRNVQRISGVIDMGSGTRNVATNHCKGWS